MLTSAPASDALTGMYEVLVASRTDLKIGSSSEVEIEDVVGGAVESVKNGVIRGMEI